jgi:glycine/D-amino acid oxidase-like deaminating enzyme
MESKQKVNIIGWGLAGTILAWKLWLKNTPFRVYDAGENHSSIVAAGLVNPIVFKRLTKSWRADDLILNAEAFYLEIGQHLKYDLLSYVPIARIFASLEEQNDWAKLCGDERFEKYISPAGNLEQNGINSPFGVGRVNSLGNIQPKLFLEKSRSFFIQKGIQFEIETFDYEVKSDQMYIFCEGFGITQNPFFNYLPMKPTHGDILTIKSKDLMLDEVVNKNMFILPLGNDLYKIGATYNWELDQAVPTETGKQELLEKLKSFTSFEFEVVEHVAGIRPTVNDRRPLLGVHPVHKNLFVFNGLGTKGVMIAPLYADKILDFVYNECELDEEVDIKRYLKHYNA